jgi:hypothetical protein
MQEAKGIIRNQMEHMEAKPWHGKLLKMPEFMDSLDTDYKVVSGSSGGPEGGTYLTGENAQAIRKHSLRGT